MSKDYERNETFRVDVDKELVDQANNEFSEDTIKGLVRRAMEEGTRSKRKEETYIELIRRLSQANSLLSRTIYQLSSEERTS